jgi:hypothetical protein
MSCSEQGVFINKIYTFNTEINSFRSLLSNKTKQNLPRAVAGRFESVETASVHRCFGEILSGNMK